eukprot:3790892-Pleurochrysis_carterae.AAC.1
MASNNIAPFCNFLYIFLLPLHTFSITLSPARQSDIIKILALSSPYRPAYCCACIFFNTANIAKSSASAAVAESPSLPLRIPCFIARILSIWSRLTPSLFCKVVASRLLLSRISADSGPCHTPYVVSDNL